MTARGKAKGSRQRSDQGKPLPTKRDRQSVEPPSEPVGPRPLSPARYALYVALTLLVPVLLWLVVEGGLRLFDPDGGLPLFVQAAEGEGRYLTANPLVARRYFAGEKNPPKPTTDLFAAQRPANSFRIFVLGESAAAGFPYPANGSFSRLLQDALRDVLTGDSVEVVNLGIAATNSYTMQDLVGEVVAAHPDAVLVYAGHNEYYGALGVASSEGGGVAQPSLVRGYLRLLGLRTFLALRDGVASLRRKAAGPAAPGADNAASLMEVLARDQQIALGSEKFGAGLNQFSSNMERIVTRLRAAGVTVFVASVASNERDLPPLASPANDELGGAREVYLAAQQAFAADDSITARAGFARARDLDVVRFRAPAALNSVVRTVAQRTGAIYVPVAEAFAAASPAGSPGHELFLEHVHPNARGYSLIARTFFDAIQSARFLGHQARPEQLRPWSEYEDGRALTALDERIVHHAQRTLLTRWPFVSADQQVDYRGTYHADGLLDSLALLVSRGGIGWVEAKLRLGAHYEEVGAPDSAAAEYRGLVRESPVAAAPRQLLARALDAAERVGKSETELRAQMASSPTANAAYQLGVMALQRRELARGIELLEQSVQLDSLQPAALYQLSLAYGLARDLPRARSTAARLMRLQPAYPGLAGWLDVIGGGLE